MMALRFLAILAFALALIGCDAVEQPLHNATRFAARMSCSCVFVMRRELADCLGDLPKDAAWLDITADTSAANIRAKALWVEGVAQFSEGRGCALQD